MHGKLGARVVVVGRTERGRRPGRRVGHRNDVTLSWAVRFCVRERLWKVWLGVWNMDWFWATFAKDNVVPVGNVVPPEVGLPHLLWSDGHWRPSQWFPQFCTSVLYFVMEKSS